MKGKNGEDTKMHYVGLFILWMIIKIIMMPNWWNVFYVIVNPLKHVIKEQNQGNILLQGKWNNFFEKSYGCKSCCLII